MLKKAKVPLIAAVILIVFGLLVVWKINNSNAETRKRPAPVTNVVLGSAFRGEINRVVTMTGNVTSVQQANIYSKVNGNIEKIYVDIGDFVKEGQVLALIDTTIYAQNARQARAALSQANANVENAKLNLDRNQALLDQNLISRQETDNARTSYNVALAQKEAAQAALSNALTQLGYCRVRAPFTGTIVKRMLDPGAYVAPSAGAQGSILFILADLDRLQAVVYLPENSISLIPEIKEIRINADAVPGKTFSGKLRKVSGSVDIATRTMESEIDINNPGRQIKPGMFVKIDIVLEKKPNTLLLPDDVVLSDPEGNYVYVVNPDSIAHKRYIRTGIRQDNRFEVLSGIGESDRVVFTGQSMIKNRGKVRILR